MAVLQKVLGEREWDSKYGRMVSIKLDFGDFQAELNTRPETLSSRLEMCETWIGKESSEWAFEDKGTWDNGDPKPKKVLSWPGKVPYSGAQEPRKAPNTRSVDRGAEQPSILASVALKAAVELGVKDGVLLPDSALAVAEYFYEWLTKKASGSAGAQTHTADPSFRADPDPPSAAEAHSGPSAGPSTSTAAEESDVATDASDEQDGGDSYGEGERTPSSCSHTYRTDPNELGVRVCVKCGDKRRRSA